jgi:ADP-heptose:LPS heptosyltransferase
MIYRGTEGILAYQKEIDELILVDREEIKQRALLKRLRHNLKTWKNVRKMKFDWVIDLTSSDRTALISLVTGAPKRIGVPLGNLLERVAYHELIEGDPKKMHIIDYQLGGLKRLGFPTLEPDMTLFVPEEIEKRIHDQWASVINSRPLVIIHPGARNPLRQWRNERFAQIADRLIIDYHAHVVLIGGPDEENSLNHVEGKMAQKPEGKTTSLQLIEVAAFLRQAQLFIGNDTATGHIAAGVGTPHIILFGPNFPQLWRPRGAKGIALFKSPQCCGCRQITCLKQENPCMDWISVEEVWKAIISLL